MSFNRTGVHNSYSSSVRIGNWSEETELKKARVAEFLARKERGELTLTKVAKHMQASLAPVKLSYHKDNVVHYGDHIMVYSVKTDGVLSVDMTGSHNASSFPVTTSTLVKSHVARNTFVIEPADCKKAKAGDVLTFGAPFRLRINPVLSEQPLYLHSQPVSTMSASKVSRKQEVVFADMSNYETVWIACYADVNQRFELEGEPVPSNVEVLLQHANTRQALSSDQEYKIYNDFGTEFEVCGHSQVSVSKKQGLYAELQGKSTIDAPVRKEGVCNYFAFLSASSPIQDYDSSEYASAAAEAASVGAYSS